MGFSCKCDSDYDLNTNNPKFSSHSTDYSDIIYWKKKGLEIREKVFEKKSLQLGKYYDSLAELCVNCGKYKLAKYNRIMDCSKNGHLVI